MRLSHVARILIAFLLTLLYVGSFAQQQDSVQVSQPAPSVSIAQQPKEEKTKKPHSPKLATIMSAVVPGSGQIYNRKWWKVPIIYGGFIGLGYVITTNTKEYNTYRDAYLIRIDTIPSTVDEFDGIYTDANLLELQEFHRRNRDLAFVGAFVLYALNIIDANVDAHLFDFDVSEDLTLNIEPKSMGLGFNSKPIVGLGISLRLK